MPRLRDISIKAKLSAGFGLSLALIFAIGAISLALLWGINSLATHVTETWLPEMEILGETKLAMDEHWLLALRRINTTDFHQIATDTAKMQAAQTNVDAGVRRLAALVDRPTNIGLLAQFGREWTAYRQSLDVVIARLDAGDPELARAELDTTTTAAFTATTKIIDDLLNASKTEGQSAAKDVRSVYGLSLAVIVAVLLFTILSVGAAIRWISQNVSKPILNVSNAMERLTAGDNSVVVSEGLDRKDEIGTLVGAVAGYRDSLNRVRQLADEADRERQRLDTALTNMSQGLCLFDADQKLVVFNARFMEIFHIPPDSIVRGMPLAQVMELALGSDKDPDAARAAQRRLLTEPLSGTVVTTLTDDRVISITHRPMQSGGFVATFEDTTERLRAEEKIRHLAHYDALTDLPNRVTFYERMEAALSHLRRSESLAVLSLDLDHFKNVNDTLGHPVGDKLLQAAADRMRSCVRGEDLVARLGGDEFAIVQVLPEQSHAVTALAERLIASVGAPYELDGHQVIVGISVGIAIAPNDGDKPDTLMKNADLALYRAKAEGGSLYRFFEIEMDARMQARRVIELDLRKAVVNGEFELYYQPIIEVKTGRIVSCEALLRWHHPERGMIPPLEFIPIAEDTGIIVPLGEWVLRQACAEAARWPSDVTVSVNLSPAQFKSKALVQTVINALAASGLPSNRLELEITELVLLEESEGALAVLHQLRDLGIRIAMDDFGTGYSSLGYLRSFPFSKIKIDGSFIRDLSTKEDSIAIVRAVVGLSSSLGMTATAEGVETHDQLARLKTEGCDEAQGFLVSPPRPAPELERLLAQQAPRVEAVA